MSRKTNCDFKPSFGEHNDKGFGYYVETLGYRTIKQQIEQFTPQAGSLGDEFYDSKDDMPVDDPSLGIRDMDLAEIGHLMVETQDALTASAKQAKQIQQTIESAGKSVSEEPAESQA